MEQWLISAGMAFGLLLVTEIMKFFCAAAAASGGAGEAVPVSGPQPA